MRGIALIKFSLCVNPPSAPRYGVCIYLFKDVNKERVFVYIPIQEIIMPKVGLKHFSYTPKGKKAAEAYAKKVSKPIKAKKK